MILHIGGEQVVQTSDLLAILDIQAAQASDTANFLRAAQAAGCVQHMDADQPKSLVIIERDHVVRVLYSAISAPTLLKRSGISFD